MTKSIDKKALLGAVAGATMAVSAVAPAFAACGGFNPCRAKKEAAKHLCNPCNPCKAKVSPCSPCHPCHPCNPCKAKTK